MVRVEMESQSEPEDDHANGEFIAGHYEGRTPPVAAVEAFENSMRKADDGDADQD